MSLKELAKQRGIDLGVAVAIDPLRNDSVYQKLVSEEFNLISTENAMKWGPMSRGKGVYDFRDADYICDFAKQHNQLVHGHVLVWYRQLPDWLTQGSFSQEELRSLLENHIRTVAGHFRGRVAGWDVVNEAIEDEGNVIDVNRFWCKHLGPEYIEFAFRVARETDPDAELFYNDWGVEDLGEKSECMYQLLSGLVQKNVPITSVGLQMHTGLGFAPSPKDVVENINRLTDLGLNVHITEMDVRLEYGKGSIQENLEEQARIYEELVGAVVRDTKVKSITFWGLDDNHSWIPYRFGPDDSGLLFDKHYQRKLSYYAVERALSLK